MDTIPVIITFKDILSNLTQKLALIISKKILFGQKFNMGDKAKTVNSIFAGIMGK